MKKWALFSFVLSSTLVSAQTPDFSGTWRLDASRSDVDLNAPLDGIAAMDEKETLHVIQPANGTLLLESSTRSSQARLYRPGHEVSNRILLGEPGTMTLHSRWDGDKLESEGLRSFKTSDKPSVKVTEVILLSGESLTIEIEFAHPEGARSSKLVYRRETSLGPCEKWPSPCKRPGGRNDERP